MVLDPQLAEAHAALGFISFYYDWNWAEGEKAFRRAIELDPDNGNYRQLLSNLMMATGRFDEGIREIEKATKSDPASIMVRAVAGRQYYLARKYDQSEAMLRRTVAMDTTFAASHHNLGATLRETGKAAEAARELEEGLRHGSSPQAALDLAVLAARSGNHDLARQKVREAQSRTRNGASLHFDLAAVSVALGDYDAAFAHLDRGIAQKYSGMVWLAVDPRFDPLRSDPRYAEYVKRVGLPQPKGS